MMLSARLGEDSLWFVSGQTQAQCLLSQGFNRNQVVGHPVSGAVLCLGTSQYKQAGGNPTDISSWADVILRAIH